MFEEEEEANKCVCVCGTAGDITPTNESHHGRLAFYLAARTPVSLRTWLPALQAHRTTSGFGDPSSPSQKQSSLRTVLLSKSSPLTSILRKKHQVQSASFGRRPATGRVAVFPVRAAESFPRHEDCSRHFTTDSSSAVKCETGSTGYRPRGYVRAVLHRKNDWTNQIGSNLDWTQGHQTYICYVTQTGSKHTSHIYLWVMLFAT